MKVRGSNVMSCKLINYCQHWSSLKALWADTWRSLVRSSYHYLLLLLSPTGVKFSFFFFFSFLLASLLGLLLFFVLIRTPPTHHTNFTWCQVKRERATTTQHKATGSKHLILYFFYFLSLARPLLNAPDNGYHHDFTHKFDRVTFVPFNFLVLLPTTAAHLSCFFFFLFLYSLSCSLPTLILFKRVKANVYKYTWLVKESELYFLLFFYLFFFLSLFFTFPLIDSTRRQLISISLSFNSRCTHL